jgi:hypothetical protein
VANFSPFTPLVGVGSDPCRLVRQVKQFSR